MSEPRFTIVAALLHERPDLMADDNEYEVFLRGREASLMAELAAVRATLANLARLAGKPDEQSTSEPATRKETTSKQSGRNKAKRYSGLTISDALVEVLEASAIPMSTGQIWTALQKEGVEPLSEDSVKSLTWALRKRARNHNDVVHVAYGKWALRKWYTEPQLRKMAKRHGGRGGLSREDHVAATKDGIERRRAAGLPVGGRSSITPERRAEVERMIRAGYSIAATAREMGVTPATIYNRIGRNKISALREAREQNEPQQEPAGEESGHLRVIK
jgi:hypothetical protein